MAMTQYNLRRGSRLTSWLALGVEVPSMPQDRERLPTPSYR
jgi:hypothetical protein